VLLRNTSAEPVGKKIASIYNASAAVVDLIKKQLAEKPARPAEGWLDTYFTLN